MTQLDYSCTLAQTSLKNWKGQPLHPIDGFTWFRTSDQERQKLIELYDALCEGDLAKSKIADELISDLRIIARTEQEFESGDC